VAIGCFGDPGLEALRGAAREPVYGLAESSIREADALDVPFAILTMGKAWVEMLNERVALAAVQTPFVGVFAGEGTGLDVARR
jgi:allantoin racemase